MVVDMIVELLSKQHIYYSMLGSTKTCRDREAYIFTVQQTVINNSQKINKENQVINMKELVRYTAAWMTQA